MEVIVNHTMVDTKADKILVAFLVGIYPTPG
jgi:hypothetical protein